jgi:hypothetical protein
MKMLMSRKDPSKPEVFKFCVNGDAIFSDKIGQVFEGDDGLGFRH